MNSWGLSGAILRDRRWNYRRSRRMLQNYCQLWLLFDYHQLHYQPLTWKQALSMSHDICEATALHRIRKEWLLKSEWTQLINQIQPLVQCYLATKKGFPLDMPKLQKNTIEKMREVIGLSVILQLEIDCQFHAIFLSFYNEETEFMSLSFAMK